MVTEVCKNKNRRLKKWYREFCLKIETALPGTKLPPFTDLDFYIDDSLKPWAQCHSDQLEIVISSDFLKVFGDRKECIKFIIDHEFCHLLVLGHGYDFEKLMLILGYYETHLVVYLKRLEMLDFYFDRFNPGNKTIRNPLSEERWCLRR